MGTRKRKQPDTQEAHGRVLRSSCCHSMSPSLRELSQAVRGIRYSFSSLQMIDNIRRSACYDMLCGMCSSKELWIEFRASSACKLLCPADVHEEPLTAVCIQSRTAIHTWSPPKLTESRLLTECSCLDYTILTNKHCLPCSLSTHIQ